MNADPEGFKRIRGRRGLLERMTTDMPLDVVLEVCQPFSTPQVRFN